MTVGSYIYRPALLGTWAIHRKLLQIHRTTAYRLDFNPLWWRLDKIPDSSWRFWEARSTFVETCSRLSSESDTLFDLPWLDQVNSTKSTSGSDSRSVSHHRLPLHKRKKYINKIESTQRKQNKYRLYGGRPKSNSVVSHRGHGHTQLSLPSDREVTQSHEKFVSKRMKWMSCTS